MGGGWIHEVKFDGYRIQAHVANDVVTLYSKNGHHFTGRFPTIAYALRDLPAKAAVIDAELVAATPAGHPDFYKLFAARAASSELCLWAFDLLHLNGSDLRELPLKTRRRKLEALLARYDSSSIMFSEGFGDPLRLLQARRHREQARGPTIPLRPAVRLDQGEDPSLARIQQRALAPL
jgi:bifunctional non-homologous end joining protein LigD